jgi:hypothetical protein
MLDPFQFVWRRSEHGYEWRTGRFTMMGAGGKPEEREGPALAPVGDFERPYVPSPDLFLEFASVDPDQEGRILAFANGYGQLGDSSRWLFPKPPRKGVKTTGVDGELRSHWQEHLHKMKAAVSLWEALRRQDTKLLSQCIQWRGAERVDYEWPPSSDFSTPWGTHATIASKQTNPHLLGRLRPGDVQMPARMYLQEVVNKSLDKLVAPRLLWTPPDRKKMGLFIVPGSLIGCLWLQLANAIAEFRTFRTCEGCGKPILVAPEGSGSRSNKRTCSDACRVRLYARRKSEARRLRDEGVPLPQIAKRLGTGVEQVKRWIAER